MIVLTAEALGFSTLDGVTLGDPEVDIVDGILTGTGVVDHRWVIDSRPPGTEIVFDCQAMRVDVVVTDLVNTDPWSGSRVRFQGIGKPYFTL